MQPKTWCVEDVESAERLRAELTGALQTVDPRHSGGHAVASARPDADRERGRAKADLARELASYRPGRGEVIRAEPAEMVRLGIADPSAAIQTALDIRAWYLGQVARGQPAGLDAFDSPTELEYAYVDGFMRFPARRRRAATASGDEASAPRDDEIARDADAFRYFVVIGIRDSVIAWLGAVAELIPADLRFDRFEMTRKGGRVTPLMLRSARMALRPGGPGP